MFEGKKNIELGLKNEYVMIRLLACNRHCLRECEDCDCYNCVTRFVFASLKLLSSRMQMSIVALNGWLNTDLC